MKTIITLAGVSAVCACTQGISAAKPAPASMDDTSLTEDTIVYDDHSSGGFQDYRTYIDAALKDILVACRGRNGIAEFEESRILCISGSLSAERQAGLPDTDYDYAYVWSGGGSADMAIELGRSISRNEAPLIIDSYCLSACANYLVPAAYGLYMTDNSVIAIHGTMPRGRQAYLMRQLTLDRKSQGDDRKAYVASADFGARVMRYLKEYPEFADKNVMMEMTYFKDIGIDDGYITRYNETIRRLTTKERYRCDPDGIVNLIVGPKHLSAFHILLIRQWFPERRKDYLEKLPTAAKEGVMIFDYDDHPFSLKKQAYVTPAYCEGMPESPPD